MVTIELAGTELQLLPERAAFLPGERALLVADAHIGKAVSFRRLGVPGARDEFFYLHAAAPPPRPPTTGTLDLLADLVERHRAQRLVFLGDFLHSPRAHAPATLGALARWRERHAALHVTLVRGNHDDRAGDPPAHLRFEVVDEPYRLGGFALQHHPRARGEDYVLAGHVHPCVSLGGRANDRVRLACFHFGERVGVLPAFGAFTGMHAVPVQPGERVYAIADERIVDLSAALPA
jgi:uncharacterized protein